MDTSKVGKLILQLRKERGMTQQNVADALNISNKTVSKWERGLGCPDVSLWAELSDILDADIRKILAGDMKPNPADNGNVSKLRFYLCPDCGGVLTSTGAASVFCCGRKLAPLIPSPAEKEHKLAVEFADGGYYITADHGMEKAHYLKFAAYVSADTTLFCRLYPEQDAAFRLPILGRGKLYIYCTKHGLFVQTLTAK